jgi:hypothetical protein
MFIGSHIRLQGESLWPSMHVVVEKEVSPEHVYNWRLAYALLKRTDEEAKRLGARLIVLGIPYLPQVYEEVWQVTFGRDPQFSPDAANRQLRRWCEENDIAYVESLDALRARVKAVKRWLHHPKDAHPTAEGQEQIALAVLASGIIEPQVPKP